MPSFSAKLRGSICPCPSPQLQIHCLHCLHLTVTGLQLLNGIHFLLFIQSRTTETHWDACMAGDDTPNDDAARFLSTQWLKSWHTSLCFHSFTAPAQVSAPLSSGRRHELGMASFREVSFILFYQKSTLSYQFLICAGKLHYFFYSRAVTIPIAAGNHRVSSRASKVHFRW